MTTTTIVRLNRAERETVNELLDYLNGHYADKLTAEGLAEQFCLPIKKMQAAVFQKTGRSLYNHIAYLRVEAAKMLILDEEPLKRVACAIGYKRPSHFGAFFKKQTGLTPLEYRDRYSTT